MWAQITMILEPMQLKAMSEMIGRERDRSPYVWFGLHCPGREGSRF